MTMTTETLDRDGLLARAPWEAHDAECKLMGRLEVMPDGSLELPVPLGRGFVDHLHSAHGDLVACTFEVASSGRAAGVGRCTGITAVAIM